MCSPMDSYAQVYVGDSSELVLISGIAFGNKVFTVNYTVSEKKESLSRRCATGPCPRSQIEAGRTRRFSRPRKQD